MDAGSHLQIQILHKFTNQLLELCLIKVSRNLKRFKLLVKKSVFSIILIKDNNKRIISYYYGLNDSLGRKTNGYFYLSVVK